MFPSPTLPIPRLTTEQMIEVDRLMIEVYQIELIQMMENAGRTLATLARELFCQGQPLGKRMAVLAGTGGNGGGAMVCARRLHNWGVHVEVYLTKQAGFTPIPAHQLQILRNMGVPIAVADELPDAGTFDLIIDGIIGYSLSGNPRGGAATLITWANQQGSPVLSLDTPSGISLTQGDIFEPVIQAEATLTLALPKVGLYDSNVAPLRGALYLADISVPPSLYAQPTLGLEVGTLFAESDILKLA